MCSDQLGFPRCLRARCPSLPGGPARPTAFRASIARSPRASADRAGPGRAGRCWPLRGSRDGRGHRCGGVGRRDPSLRCRHPPTPGRRGQQAGRQVSARGDSRGVFPLLVPIGSSCSYIVDDTGDLVHPTPPSPPLELPAPPPYLAFLILLTLNIYVEDFSKQIPRYGRKRESSLIS